ncbi:MAG TPA: hypothetical protein VK934_07335, partial [Fimbriimonas sp.]|nr:hypothetical protein [Fimbriimonas sp.]
LKRAINDANVPVHGAIYEMAETKGLVAFLKALGTARGKVPMGYMMGETPEYEAQITAQEALDEITRLEARIDDLQDILDQHNASTQIEIEE